jgi:hypothetical protein
LPISISVTAKSALIENYGSRKELETKLKAAGVRLKPGIWADDAG